MRKGYSLLTAVFCIVGLIGLTATPARAQLDDVGTIIQSGAADANLLAKSYLEPFGKGFGAGLNSGWFNTAKTHKTLGFDITINGTLALVPGADQSFNVSDLALQKLTVINGVTNTPTLNGSDNTTTTEFAIREQVTAGGTSQTVELGRFQMPEGSGIEFVPAPMIQATVGTIKNTDLTLRWLPEIDQDDFGRLKLFGIGIKHGINQWLPGGNLLPVNLAVQAGFTSLDIDADLNLDPGTADVNDFSASNWDGQEITTSTNSFTANAIVSKDIPFITVFGGVGIESATMEVRTKGNFPITAVRENTSTTDPTDTETFITEVEGKDLFNFDIESDNSVHALAGFKVKLAFFHITGSYTLASYPMAQASVGFSFR